MGGLLGLNNLRQQALQRIPEIFIYLSKEFENDLRSILVPDSKIKESGKLNEMIGLLKLLGIDVATATAEAGKQLDGSGMATSKYRFDHQAKLIEKNIIGKFMEEYKDRIRGGRPRSMPKALTIQAPEDDSVPDDNPAFRKFDEDYEPFNQPLAHVSQEKLPEPEPSTQSDNSTVFIVGGIVLALLFISQN